MIKTGRQDIYIRHVERAEANREDEDSESDSGTSDQSGTETYFFQYQYELFSFGAVLGFLRDEQVDEDATYGQDIRRVEDISEDNKHRQTIDFITNIVQVRQQTDGADAWDDVLRYADAGVQIFDEETDDDLDFVKFIQDASADEWEERFEETIGTPGDVGSL
jgi:hypothetical protein